MPGVCCTNAESVSTAEHVFRCVVSSLVVSWKICLYITLNRAGCLRVCTRVCVGILKKELARLRVQIPKFTLTYMFSQTETETAYLYECSNWYIRDTGLSRGPYGELDLGLQRLQLSTFVQDHTFPMVVQ